MLFRFIPAPFAFTFDGVQRRSDGAVMPPGKERALPSASAGTVLCWIERGKLRNRCSAVSSAAATLQMISRDLLSGHAKVRRPRQADYLSPTHPSATAG